MFKFRVNVDSVPFTTKPTKDDTAAIKNRLAQYGPIETTVNQLIKCIKQGKTWTPAALSGTKDDSWQSQQIIAADIDNKAFDGNCLDHPLTTITANAILSAKGITHCIYRSFSWAENYPKFRVMIFLDEPVKDVNEAKELTQRLIKLFDDTRPGCVDSKTFNPSRIFYGGRADCFEYGFTGTCQIETLRRELPQLPQPPKYEPPKAKRGRPPKNGHAPGFCQYGIDLHPVLDYIASIMGNLSYNEWFETGCAIKTIAAKYPDYYKWDCSTWDSISRNDSRYKAGACETKWRTINRQEAGAPKLIEIAKNHGWIEPRAPKKREAIPAPDEAPAYIVEADKREKARNMNVKPNPMEGNNTTPAVIDAADPDPTPSPAKQETYEPADYTDVGQATVYARVFDGIVKYTPATSFIVYDGTVWNESEIKAQGLTQELTEMQLTEARERVRRAQDELNVAVETQDQAKIKAANAQLAIEEAYRKYVLGQRKTAKIKATMIEARPKIEIDVSDLDANGYLLNTPAGSVDLITGELYQHNPLDYCTKITAVAPSDENANVFADFLDRVTVGDNDLARYLQEVAGMCAIGHVLRENLIIAYGQGGNGKSTLFNLLAHVMGDYAGHLSSEILTAQCRKNKSPEYAELRGKRIVIAAELEEGMRLDTSTVKRLCSTDDIQAEKKYKDPFSYRPSHTVILYTNHLPRVGTNDKGTWDRLICIPFNANFRGTEEEILNYSDYLFTCCGGAVLSWIIEGAKRFIANDYKITLPECVVEALQKYRADNDWLQAFLYDCCVVERTKRERSSDLYNRYREYCDEMGEYTRHISDFKAALLAAGYEAHSIKGANYIFGIGLKPAELAEVYSSNSVGDYTPQAQ